MMYPCALVAERVCRHNMIQNNLSKQLEFFEQTTRVVLWLHLERFDWLAEQ